MEKCTATGAYFMKEASAEEGQKTPLRLSDEIITVKDLEDTGCLAYKVDMSVDWEKAVEKYSEDVGMRNRDIVRINPVTMPGYTEKLAIFFEEHLHTDPEVRFIMEGAGYFDIRDVKDRWIRIPVAKGDLLFLPAGIYHRFTTDETDSIVAMRFFKDAPCWEAHNRKKEETESMVERKDYVERITAH
ncbi:hypothetical protein PFISCL1PPCAC_27431 [Pristionchus fissidentatus]|uniref:Acireductone dioxygenase n=1 Tax=Pristionchus fissidentatus TaxID=1538716 RepID=A0AAV5WZN1_9BILA|nr:hypothetical protein PFISCL1PPCAC_27431 [Pristionchus fissidentatus]